MRFCFCNHHTRKTMNIVMKLGESKYMGIDVDRMYVVASLEKAMVFEHAGDICSYINENRKKINAFLRRQGVHMTIKVIDDKVDDADTANDGKMSESHQEFVSSGSVLNENEYVMNSNKFALVS